MMVDRFKLAAHHESKEQPVYALLVANGGPKLKKSENGADVRSAPSVQNVSEGYTSGRVWTGQGAPPPLIEGRDITSATGKMHMSHVSLASFAKSLSSHLDRPVIDLSGIPGEYDFDFAGGSDFVSELRAYGLKVESRKGAVDVLFVD